MYVLIGISILLAIGFLASFIWAVKDHQFKDDVTPSYRILFDEKSKKKDKE
jgi:cbb3-type cytochrome oxidase maturation protein